MLHDTTCMYYCVGKCVELSIPPMPPCVRIGEWGAIGKTY